MAERKGALLAAGLRKVESGRLGFAEAAKLAGTAIDGRRRELASECRGARTGARRIGKNMQVAERMLLDEAECEGVVFFALAGEGSNDIGADSGVRQLLRRGELWG